MAGPVDDSNFFEWEALIVYALLIFVFKLQFPSNTVLFCVIVVQMTRLIKVDFSLPVLLFLPIIHIHRLLCVS